MNTENLSGSHEYEYSKIVKLKCIQLEYAVSSVFSIQYSNRALP